MATRQKQIIRELKGIGPASFQRLVDELMLLEHPEITSHSPEGSHETEDKPTTGHPDSLYWLPKGKMWFAEHTTTAKERLVTKFKGDIDDVVVAAKKKGWSLSEIQKVYLCHNRKSRVKQAKELIEYGASKGLDVVVLGGSDIATTIATFYPHLARDYFGLPFDTGQTMTVSRFREYYDARSAGIATPLTNPYQLILNNVEKLRAAIKTAPIVVLSGPAGVGKTRICIEELAIREKTKGRRAIVIVNNNLDIWEDLHSYLISDRPLDLFIDDANRQLPNLHHILHFLQTNLRRDIRVIMTVREFAKVELLERLSSLSYKEVVMNKATDEEIINVIKEEPFTIRNEDVQRHILRKSKGSYRFSIMASRLARDNYREFLNGGVGKLYEEYYTRYLPDFSSLQKSKYVKTLAALAFYRTLDVSKAAHSYLKVQLKPFGLTARKFIKVVDDLRQRELVDRQYELVKIEEQNLASYFFYIAVIRDKKINLLDLLQTQFPNQQRRFNELFTEINNDFGHENLKLQAVPSLLDYAQTIDAFTSQQLFETFYYLIQPHLLGWARGAIAKHELLEESDGIFPPFAANRKVETYGFDPILKILSHLYDHNGEYLEQSLRLSFNYVQRKPERYSQLIDLIREKLLYRSTDFSIGFLRQHELFRFLFPRVTQGNRLSERVFLELAVPFLQHEMSMHELIEDDRVQIRKVEIGAVDGVVSLREKIWAALLALWPSYSHEIIDKLSNISGRYGRVTKKVIQQDKIHLLDLFDNHFDPSDLKHIVILHRLASWLRKHNLYDERVQNLQARFTSKAFELFKSFDWNYQDYRLALGQEADKVTMEEWKKEEAKKYVFKSDEDVSVFLDLLKELSDLANRGIGTSNGDRTLVMILTNNIRGVSKLGMFCLLEVIKYNNNFFGMSFSSMVVAVVVELRRGKEFITALSGLRKDHTKGWLLRAFRELPDEDLDEDLREKFTAAIQQLEGYFQLSYETLKKYASSEEQLVNWLELLASKMDEGAKHALLDVDNLPDAFVIKYTETVKKVYLSGVARSDIFDHDHKLLKLVLSVDKDFFFLAAKAIIKRNRSSIHRKDLKFGFIWGLGDFSDPAKKLIEELLESEPWISYDDSPLSILFNGVQDNSKSARDFALLFIRENTKNVYKVSAILAAIRKTMMDMYPSAVAEYLEGQPSFVDFKSIRWVCNGVSIGGKGTNFSQIRADRWRKVETLLNELKVSVDLLPYQAYVQEQIQAEFRSARRELRRAYAGS